MSTPSPFSSRGSFLEYAGAREHRRHHFAVIASVTASAILFLAFILFGCRRHAERAELTNTSHAAPDASRQTNAPVRLATEEATPVQTLPAPGPIPGATPQIAEPQSAVLTPARQVLAVPKLTPEPALKDYTVKKGDTFAKIALANGVTIGAIGEVNLDADSRRLRIGQVLQIPVVREAPAASTSHDASAQASDGPQTYVVKKGDTLSRIGTAHGTTARAMRALNELRTDRITVGQKLKLPPANSPVRAANPRPSAATNAPASLSMP